MNALNENLVIVIPARKNSKRLKNKNFKNFFGFPLFEWSPGRFISKATA